jgi:diaminohydroxyphosphoribosylaminopyrimidine deaminase/5-amino-6-(5-phosphoribosylamino)uracil reductase
MYVTLEPCAHEGRQPPCVEAILEAGIGRVVIASDDPSEKASGRGPGILRDGGVEVAFATGAEATVARRLNQPFRKHARTGLPLVVLKMAMSLDGQTTTQPGDSPWISGPESRELVHQWRAESDAIAVGIGTALTDDPLLTARPAADETKRRADGGKSPGQQGEAVRQPLRVVFDSQARLPLESQLLQTLDQAPVLVVAAPDAPSDRISALRETGADVVQANGLEPALRELGARNITSLFLEGGKTLASSFLSADLIDESRTFLAPMLLGRQPTPPPRAGDVVGGTIPWAVAGDGGSPAAAGPARLQAQESSAKTIGEDVLITARYKEW